MSRVPANILIAAFGIAIIAGCTKKAPDAAEADKATPAAPAVAAVPAARTLRATGNEPNWRLEMSESGILLVTDQGETRAGAPVLDTTFADGSALYVASGDKGQVAVKVIDQVCTDSMSGMPHPQRVQVWMDGQGLEPDLQGCGGDPASLLQGAEWTVDELGGAALVKDSKVTLNFGADGKLSGSSSCNRFMSSYKLSGEGLTISQGAGSMMACEQPLMDQERAFLALLAEVKQFGFTEDGALLLKAADGRAIRARR